MRVLIVSFAFPPFNSIGGVRVSKTVKYLMEFGHDVRVITSRDQPFPETLPLEIPEERIIYSRWLTVRKMRGAKAPASTAAAPPAQNGHARSRAGRVKASVIGRLGDWYKVVADFPDSNIGWLPFAVSEASKLFESWRPELILASSPPPTSLLVAYRLHRKFGIPWVAELRDLWMDHPYHRPPAWRKALEERLERRVLSSAAGIVTVSRPMAENLKGKYKKDVAVVLNGFDPEDYPPPSNERAEASRLRILYTGMIYPGKRDPSPLFEALSRMGSMSEHVRVLFYGSFLETARELAERYGVHHLVEVHGPVPYRDSLRMQREADILLLLLWSNPKEEGVYTGKLFEYLGARRPVLSVGGTETVAAALIRERRAGATLSDPARIAAQLETWIKEKSERGAIAPLPDEAVAGLSREEQTRVLEDYLQNALSAVR